MKKFKIGEIITGTNFNEYGYTNSAALMKVIKVLPQNMIRVKVIDHCNKKTLKITSRHFFDVFSRSFKKIPKLKRALLFGK